MSSNKIPEYVLLSNVIRKLRDKDYYRTFAKTLIMTNLPDRAIPSDENLVKEMFQHFIENNNLQIYFNQSEATTKDLQEEAERRVLEKTSNHDHNGLTTDNELESIWENEVYINVKGLKKLYANKCIVFPNSLLNN